MRPVRALAAAAVALAAALTTLVAAPAEAAPVNGTISITLVDENGDPMPGSIDVYSADGSVGMTVQGVATREESVPPGSYGVMVFSPWGGMQCAGIAPCDYSIVLGSSVGPDGSVVVASGETTEITIRGEAPATLTGSGRVGSPLTLAYSSGMTNLLDYLDVVVGAYYPTVTWLRDGAPIGGVDATTYVPVAADAGTEVSVRLSYTGAAQMVFATVNGGPVEPRTTDAVLVKRIPTKTYALISNPTIRSGSRGKVRIEVTASGQVVTGKVTVGVGSWSQTRSLINGSARVLLPRLPAGRHSVTASFLGSSTYPPSTAKPKTLTVTSG